MCGWVFVVNNSLFLRHIWVEVYRIIIVIFRNQMWMECAKGKTPTYSGEVIGPSFPHISVLKNLPHCLIFVLLEISMELKVNRAGISSSIPTVKSTASDIKQCWSCSAGTTKLDYAVVILRVAGTFVYLHHVESCLWVLISSRKQAFYRSLTLEGIGLMLVLYELEERWDLNAMVMTIHKMELFYTGKTFSKWTLAWTMLFSAR